MILITGATGNVGSEVVAALLPAQAGQIRVWTSLGSVDTRG